MIKPLPYLALASLTACSSVGPQRVASETYSRPEPIAERVTNGGAETTVITGEVLQVVPEGMFVRPSTRAEADDRTLAGPVFIRGRSALEGSTVEIRGYRDGVYDYPTVRGTRTQVPAVRAL